MIILQRHILLLALLVVGCESMPGMPGPLALQRSPQEAPRTVTFHSRSILHVDEVIAESNIWTAGAQEAGVASQVSTGTRLSKGSRVGNTLSTIFFSLESWEINPEIREQLDATAQWMQCFPNSGLRIEGHTDVQGTESYKMVLGARRALAIKDYLSHLGISAQRLETVSYGKEFMVCEADDDALCHQNNRRVELLLEQRKYFINNRPRKCMVHLNFKLHRSDVLEEEARELAFLPDISGGEISLIYEG